MSKQTRKDFLKKMALAVGVVSVTPMLANSSSILKDNANVELSDEEKELLFVYEKWLQEFESCVDKRSENPLDIDNNKRIMELSEESNQWVDAMREYMKKPYFEKLHTNLTRKITEKIA